MRSARLQSQDLSRTGQFITTLLSKDDIRDLEKPEVPEPPKPMANGHLVPNPNVNPAATSFRGDSKPRFSDPPAPPPQQPLPEKPDVPSLKRATTERPKSHPTNASPVRQDNVGQIIQLTEALNNAKREIDTQTQRMRNLEEMLQHEREAREMAEDMAKRLEDTSVNKEMNGVPKSGSADTLLEAAFEPPREAPEPVDTEMVDADVSFEDPEPVENAESVTTEFQSKIDTMMSEMKDLKQQMEAWRQRCETAEAERDADRQSLANMVLKIRKDEETREAEAVARAKSRSQSKRRGRSRDPLAQPPTVTAATGIEDVSQDGLDQNPSIGSEPTLSRANTITPATAASGPLAVQDKALTAGLPYASMMGVVLIGMGLMAYLNGLNPPPPRPVQ